MPDPTPSFPHLKHAPIIEAVIDLRVRLPATFDVTHLRRAQDQFKDKYPVSDEQKFISQILHQTPDQPPKMVISDQGISGYQFRTQDHKNLAQFRRDGFTFNRLQPYTSWDEIFPEASSLWHHYASVAQPEEISRIAVRYINRIVLPLPNLELSHYMTTEPPLPKGVPQNITGLLSRISIHDPASDINANIVQALEPPLNEQYISLILDIDVYQANVSHLTQETVLERFGRLREMKNKIFFGSLTEKGIALFQ